MVPSSKKLYLARFRIKEDRNPWHFHGKGLRSKSNPAAKFIATSWQNPGGQTSTRDKNSSWVALKWTSIDSPSWTGIVSPSDCLGLSVLDILHMDLTDIMVPGHSHDCHVPDHDFLHEAAGTARTNRGDPQLPVVPWQSVRNHDFVDDMRRLLA